MEQHSCCLKNNRHLNRCENGAAYLLLKKIVNILIYVKMEQHNFCLINSQHLNRCENGASQLMLKKQKHGDYGDVRWMVTIEHLIIIMCS